MRVTGNVAPIWFKVGAIPATWSVRAVSAFDASFHPPATDFELRSRIQGSANCRHVECLDRHHFRVGWHIKLRQSRTSTVNSCGLIGRTLKRCGTRCRVISHEIDRDRWPRHQSGAQLRVVGFPCHENRKPACPHGFKEATTDPTEIIKLWRRYPGSVIGIATGKVSGRSVLDIDVKHEPALAWWRTNYRRLPSTRTFRSRSGGLHLYFQHADGIRNTQSKLCPGLDTRGDGGYIIYWFAVGYASVPITLRLRLGQTGDFASY